MTSDEQLQKWLEGESLCPNDRGECCPDFSCCKPNLLVPREVRQAFMDATQDQRYDYCMIFLGAAMIAAHTSKKVHIVGSTEES